MKKIISIIFIASFALTMFAQLPVITTKVKTLPAIKEGQICPINTALQDTMKTGDTIFYKIQVNHSEIGYPYLSLLLKRVAGADTATVTATFWQSVDGTHNWQQIKYLSQVTTVLMDTTKYWRHIGAYGVFTGTGTSVNTETAFSVSLTKAIMKTGTSISFWRNNACFESQYLGIRLVSAVSSSFKGIYYGSLRYNNK